MGSSDDGRSSEPRRIVFHPDFIQDLRFWLRNDRRLLELVFDRVEETVRTPFTGRGKPEPLKHDLRGAWSRKLNDKHRILYRVTADSIYFLSGRSHYGDR